MCRIANLLHSGGCACSIQRLCLLHSGSCVCCIPEVRLLHPEVVFTSFRRLRLLHPGGCICFIPEVVFAASQRLYLLHPGRNAEIERYRYKNITAACQKRCRLVTACHQVRRLTGACVLRPGLYYNGRRTVRCFLTDSDISQQPGQRQSLRMNSTQRPTRNQAIR